MEDSDEANTAEKLIAKIYEKADNYGLRGSLQLIPVVGSTLDTWFFGPAEQAKAERVKNSLEDLRARVEKLEVDSEYFKDHIEEFGYLTERAVRDIAQDYRKDMRSAYVKMLARFYSKEFSSLDNKELYLQYLESLLPIHLVILKQLIDNLGSQEGLKIQPGENVEDTLLKYIGGGIDRTLVVSLVNDLVTHGMFEHAQNSAIGGDVHIYKTTEMGKIMLKLIEE